MSDRVRKKRPISEEQRERNRIRANEWNRTHKEQMKERHKRYHENHPEKRALFYKNWYEANKDRVRLTHKRRNLMIQFNITLEEWEELIQAQNGECAICFKTLDRGKDTYVDHCHATGIVRGILCSKCNIGLGQFDDDTAKLQRAIEYLESSRMANEEPTMGVSA